MTFSMPSANRPNRDRRAIEDCVGILQALCWDKSDILVCLPFRLQSSHNTLDQLPFSGRIRGQEMRDLRVTACALAPPAKNSGLLATGARASS